MRCRFDWQDKRLFRMWSSIEGQGEIGWVLFFRLRGLGFDLELPSTWHEAARVWVHWSLGFISGGFSWRFRGKPYPDHGQCSGPRYGFKFHDDMLWIYHGQDDGGWRDRRKTSTTIYMPWAWTHVRHSFLNYDGTLLHNAGPGEYQPPRDSRVKYDFTYTLASGEVQKRVATINGEEREWRLKYAPWLPWPRMRRRSINIEFDQEVGERTGSWKGGTVGCGWDWKPGETQEQALKRMERERKL